MKAIKVKLYPKPKQQKLFEKHFGCCRYIYNYALNKKIETYTETKKSLSYGKISETLPKLKEENEWLKEVNAQSLQQTLKDLESGFSHFFKKNNAFPKFKSKKNPKQSFRVPQDFKISSDKHYIKLPKIGYIKFIDKFNIPENIDFRNITILRENNQYFASIVYDEHQIQLPKQEIVKEKTLGIDLGVTTLMSLSDGTKIENPKHFKKYQEKLAEEQQKLSKIENKELKSYQKQKEKVNKVHEKIKNVRRDFLHKVTTSLVENQNWTSYCMEDLSVKGMLEDNPTQMSRAISDCAFGITRNMMEYKTSERGKNFILIGRFDSSSKTCNICGNVNHNLKRGDKVWTCERCQTLHDRDKNASLNIRDFGIIKSLGNDSSEAVTNSDASLEPTML